MAAKYDGTPGLRPSAPADDARGIRAPGAPGGSARKLTGEAWAVVGGTRAGKSTSWWCRCCTAMRSS